MIDAFDGLRIAGRLDPVDRALLIGLDVEAIDRIGLTDLYTAPLLLKIFEHSERSVSDFVRTLELAEPLNAAQLDELLDIGIDRVVQRLNETGLRPFNGDELLDAMRPL